LDRRYAAILTTLGDHSGRIIMANHVWIGLHALLVKHQLLIPASRGDYDPPGLLGHIALRASDILSPSAGQYLFARAWNDHDTAIEVSLSTGMTDHIALAACLAWKANGDRPVFRESEDLPKDWLKDRDLAAQVMWFARDVGLARPPAMIDYSLIVNTTTWATLV
jgi:hypothetical protein